MVIALHNFTFMLHGVYSWIDQSEIPGGWLTVKAQPPEKLKDNLYIYANVPAQSELCADVLESLW